MSISTIANSGPLADPPDKLERAPDERLNVRSSIPFFIAHLAGVVGLVSAFVIGVNRRALELFGILYLARMFFVTAGYHRYFSHRSYKLNRFWQFIMAFGGTTCAQKGPLWWAAHHRDHHRYSDTASDIHSPKKGFWWSHVGWILCDKTGPTKFDRIRDFAKYPELRFLNKYDWIGPWALGAFCFWWAGFWGGLMFAFFFGTVLLWHGTFTINSLAHVFGKRRYDTSDTSRNSFLLALYTGGEGWHNNHHHYQASARQGFYWWEIDPVYYGLRVLSWIGIVHDLKTPPKQIRNDHTAPRRWKFK